MNTYVALLRGINVGGNNLLPMKALTTILESLGCDNVRTYIQSGNAVFDVKRVLPKGFVETFGTAVQRDHGFKPHVVLLRAAELAQAIKNNPFPVTDGKALHFFFLDSSPENPDLASLNELKADSEDFAMKGRVFFLYTPAGLGRSKLAAKVERALGVPATARNWNTASKLAEMAGHAT